MTMTKLNGSSHVKSVGFENGVLRIRFHDVALRFSNVSERIYQGLLNSDDPGGYYQRYVHGRFRFQFD